MFFIYNINTLCFRTLDNEKRKNIYFYLHCCPEKFYHSVSCLGPLPSGTLAVRSV